VQNLIKNLNAILGQENVLSRPDELLVYECDGLPQHKHRPRAVVFPASTEQTAAVMKELSRANVPFTPRGAGTGLSGGALALNEGVVIEMARMRKVLKIDTTNRLAIVQPGVVNLQVSRAVAPFGLYYVPDPSSQPTCTIGGNIAEGAGGIHCLKYGTTTDHVLGCRVVLAGGEIVDLGGAGIEAVGYDLLGTFIGSEGTFGIATEATLRLVQSPPAIRTLLAEFGEVNNASHAVSAIIAAGVMPAALEMMDREIIRAVEASVFAAGLPPDAGAALIIELDGIEAGIDDEAERVTSICMEFGARSCRRARDETERKKLWAARKGAFGAIGRISPDSMIQDAVVPRSQLPEVLNAAYEIAGKYQLRIANVFHAGDGNLHPLICFDSRIAEEVTRVKDAGRELMAVCVAAGGTITGEHGVGLDKRELLPLVFSEADMNAMLSVRAAFDPSGLCNPGKIIPLLQGCGEARAVSSTSFLEPHADRQSPSNTAESYTEGMGREPTESRSRNRKKFQADRAALELAKIVGGANIDLSTGTLIISPGSNEEVSEVMKLAARESCSVLPAGGMTWITNTSKSSASFIVKTTRLNNIVEHEPADLIAVTQAGVKLSDFNETLARNGQWLPLDPPDDGLATIGGVVATGMGGAQQYGYGGPRGSVIGMRVVLANGDTIKVGGRVVKNVAGYDLCKLFTGSYGTLGVITEINFKLRPRPASEATVVAVDQTSNLILAARRIIDARLFPIAAELLSSAMSNRLGLTTAPDNSTLVIRFAGNEKGVAFQTQQALSQLNSQTPMRRTELISDDAGLWRSLAAAPMNSKQALTWRASVLPSELQGFVDNVQRIYGESFQASSWQIGAGDGRMRMLDNVERSKDQTMMLIKELRNAARSAGGTLSIEDTNETLALGIDSSIDFGSTTALMQRVKQRLDPQHIFLEAAPK
jgi:glycolate oxidase subunit GlcD